MSVDADNDRLDALLEFVQSERRVCPQPTYWNKLWELLPDRRRAGVGWEPSLPLILAAWWEATDAEKRRRLADHIRYAASNGALATVDAFLRCLPPSDWSYEHEC